MAIFLTLPHTKRDGITISPSPGYVWRSGWFWPAGTIWSPGKAHPEFANVVAGTEPDEWTPRLGYAWDDAAKSDVCSGERRADDRGQSVGFITSCRRMPPTSASWVAGLRDEAFPHVETTDREGVWKIDDGYRVVTPGSLRVVWTANVPHQDRPHLRSGATEGQWVPEPGYETRTIFFSTQEVWAPGTAHPDWQHVVAAEQEGFWRAEEGYTLARQPDGTLVATRTRGRMTEFVVGAGLAMAGQVLSRPNDQDGFVTQQILRPAARELRDAGIRQAGEALR